MLDTLVVLNRGSSLLQTFCMVPPVWCLLYASVDVVLCISSFSTGTIAQDFARLQAYTEYDFKFLRVFVF